VTDLDIKYQMDCVVYRHFTNLSLNRPLIHLATNLETNFEIQSLCRLIWQLKKFSF